MVTGSSSNRTCEFGANCTASIFFFSFSRPRLRFRFFRRSTNDSLTFVKCAIRSYLQRSSKLPNFPSANVFRSFAQNIFALSFLLNRMYPTFSVVPISTYRIALSSAFVDFYMKIFNAKIKINIQW